jgi:predicted RNA-binding Zn-ribbon protein involved in translation (DUF1610 family)
MASIIGRKACPWCGFESAHVKQNPDKLPFHHCPDCGTMTQARNGTQAKHITANMRTEPHYTSGAYEAASQAVAGGPPVPPVAADPIVVTGVVVRSGLKQTDKVPKAACTTTLPAGGNGIWSQLMGGANG